MGFEREELHHWLRLSLTPGVGDGTSRKLLAAFGLPDAIFAQPQSALLQVVSQAQARALVQQPPELEALADQTWQWLQADPERHRILTLADDGYPASLLQTADPPLLLHLVGPADFDLTQLGRSLAVVGSRNPTPQGASNAKAFGRALGEAGVAVVSGLALGIDGAAHEGALEAVGNTHRLATVAVVGTGLDRVYPARHRQLAHRIAQQGLLVSELPLGTPPLTQNFPKRNRIIAGLTRGTLVVEAALQSGSLITARLAVEQGKEVFAIPGSIHSPQSRGCHALIRQGAKLVETVKDIFEDLDLRTESSPPVQPAAAAPDDQDAPPLLAALGHDPVSLDALIARTGSPAAQLQAQLLELELAGEVARLPGGLFQRIGHA
ncbi:DNA-processing protein DprA [Variovorax sp. OV329]|uniref:DNA-processing protein DprA n=1 Tax=Variovorax sp. OV329 TaxID=1882825 RepID=UPI0008E5D345|nr:DNA-processing protein DprA [Variovorax sp. OV329]SFM33038.1 DNA processing protein [Variovorax sp. OV329]